MYDWLKLKFDNLSLLGLILVLIGVLVYSDRLGSDKLVSWMEQTITTVLGAYIGLTQAGRTPWKGQGTNGTTTTSSTLSTKP